MGLQLTARSCTLNPNPKTPKHSTIQGCAILDNEEAQQEENQVGGAAGANLHMDLLDTLNPLSEPRNPKPTMGFRTLRILNKWDLY